MFLKGSFHLSFIVDTTGTHVPTSSSLPSGTHIADTSTLPGTTSSDYLSTSASQLISTTFSTSISDGPAGWYINYFYNN